MIDPNLFVDALDQANIGLVTGVPDSLLKEVCAVVTENSSQERHIPATNEGSAVGLAIGYYLGTGRPALVYMQNSGLGNTVNPLTSLADPEVYGIPMILMIGWRGEMLADGSQMADEPQHVKQGAITLEQLEILDIPYQILDSDTVDVAATFRKLVGMAMKRSGPAALVVRKNTFAPFKSSTVSSEKDLLRREEVIELVVTELPADMPVVSTTGKASRELFELRRAGKGSEALDFLTVGGMGHASQIAAGIAVARPGQRVLCLDGDGALLMHSGGLAITAERANLVHIVITNGAHDSVGGQPTAASKLNLSSIAEQFGYGLVARAFTADDIVTDLRHMIRASCSAFLEVRCKLGTRTNLGRPDRSPADSKRKFMNSMGSASDG